MDKKVVFIILATIVVLHIVLVLISMAQPFQGDEVLFSECAKNYVAYGKPLLIQSQFSNYTLYPDLDKEYHFSSFHSSCLGHPPLYINVLAAFIYFFGESDYSLRMVQAIFGVFNVLLVFLISRKIFEKSENKYLISLVAVALYALNPLVIQSSIITDIDGGTLNFFTLLFTYFFISKKNLYYLVPALTLIMWNKFSEPIILFGVTLLFYLMQRDWKGMGKNVLLFALSGSLFLLTFWLYSHLQNVNFLYPFANTFSSERVLSNHFAFSSILRSAWSFKIFSYFANPFLIISFSILSLEFYFTIYYRLRDKVLDNAEKSLLFINLSALVTILFYIYLGANAWGFPKYYIATMAPLCIFISPFTANILSKIQKNKLIPIAILYLLLAIFIMMSLKDPLIPEFDQTASNVQASFALMKVSITFAFYVIIPFIITLFFTLWLFRRRIFTAIILLIIFFYIYINAIQALTGYSSYYRYGDTGVLETIQFFRDNNIPVNQIASYPNIGYYLGMSEYYDITFVYHTPQLFKKNVIDHPEIDYIVIHERDIARIGEEQMNYFRIEKKIGSYYIYKKNTI